MALIVETGAGVPGAESYLSLADADSWHSKRNNTAWSSAVDTQREAALRLATDYIDGHYRHRWHGWRVQPVNQSLEWPRYGVPVPGSRLRSGSAFYDGFIGSIYLPSNQIPQRLKDAVCEAALRSLAGPLLADVDQTVSREKVGPLETWYASGVDVATTYPAIDSLLSGLLLSPGMGDLSRG